MIVSIYFGNSQLIDQTFGGVVKEKNVFKYGDYSGLIGQAYPGLGEPPGMTPFFDNVMKHNLIKYESFGLYISRHMRYTSRFWLGGIDNSYLKSGKIDSYS